MATKYTEHDSSWVDRAIETCTEAEEQLNQYHDELTKDAEECLRLADEALSRQEYIKEPS